MRAERGQCHVAAETGPARAVVVPPAGTGDRLTPCTGDWAAVRPATAAVSATFAEVMERRTAVVRSASSHPSHAQVPATNVDTVAVTASLADPLKHGRIERTSALAWDSGATPVVVLTEADRCADPVSAVSEVAAVAAGVAVLITRTTTGQGMDVLTPGLSGTVVLLGPSGADKSTLGNRLLGGDFPATGPVRDRDGKGGPTTAWRDLLPLPHGGVLPDTPGLRGVYLHDADEGPDQPFAEITQQARDRRTYAASRTDARLRAELERPKKRGALLRRAIKQSPNSTA